MFILYDLVFLYLAYFGQLFTGSDSLFFGNATVGSPVLNIISIKPRSVLIISSCDIVDNPKLAIIARDVVIGNNAFKNNSSLSHFLKKLDGVVNLYINQQSLCVDDVLFISKHYKKLKKAIIYCSYSMDNIVRPLIASSSLEEITIIGYRNDLNLLISELSSGNAKKINIVSPNNMVDFKFIKLVANNITIEFHSCMINATSLVNAKTTLKDHRLVFENCTFK